jgi:hypothetical protein
MEFHFREISARFPAPLHLFISPKMELDPPSVATTGDALPHGLPLRFSNLSIPDPGGRAGSDVLVDTVASSMLDLATLGPLRRVINAARRPTGHAGKGKEKLLVDQVEGIVHQVSLEQHSLRVFLHSELY